MSGWDGGPHAGLKIGRTLELARKERGLSLKQAEEETKIRAAYLRELERENFDVLPAVYVQGSLKTYANFLHLDGDALVQELKRRQATREEPPYPLYVGPQEDDSLDDILAAAGGAPPAAKSPDEEREKAGPVLLPARGSGYLYLGFAVFLVLAVAAAAFALTGAGDERPSAVPQVREPLISQAPETSPPDVEENAGAQQPEQGEEQRTDDGKEGAGPGEPEAGNEEDGAEQASRTEQDQDDPRPARNSASATASAPERDAEKRAPGSAEPSRRSPDPTRQDSTAPRSSPRPSGQPGGAPSGGNSSPPPRSGGELEVRVAVGADDPVRLSGGPFDD
jgi:cytoskeleton protein RodZ